MVRALAAPVTEGILYAAARALYRTEVAHTKEMKAAVSDLDTYDQFRAAESRKMMAALGERGITIAGKTVVDFGCNDGAMSAAYLAAGARQVIGVDIDAQAIVRARQLVPGPNFRESRVDHIPIDTASVDVLVTFDVLEHVAHPDRILTEMHRILKPGGRAVIATIGWWMPFAPHLWAVMPVPWAHVLWSERSLLHVCRRVYRSAWYAPNMHDLDENGERFADKYTQEAIPREYLNHYRVRDFERAFRRVGFRHTTDIATFKSRYLGWLKPLAHVPIVREFIGGSVWFVLEKP